MLHLYHCAQARSFRPLWALEEMRLEYRLTMLPFPPRVLAKDYLTVNLLGTVPFLIDGETKMTESVAICQYLATRYGPSDLVVGPSEPGYGDWLNALYQGEATLTFPQSLVLRYGRYEPAERRQPQVVSDYSRWFLARLRWLEAKLSTSDYVAADRFTIGDISVGYALLLAVVCNLSSQFPSQIARYYRSLQGRPGFLAALKAENTPLEYAGVQP
jgi:glutathione S-transferase